MEMIEDITKMPNNARQYFCSHAKSELICIQQVPCLMNFSAKRQNLRGARGSQKYPVRPGSFGGRISTSEIKSFPNLAALSPGIL